MRRIDVKEALERLDEIEALTSMPGRDGNAFDMKLYGIDDKTRDLMFKVARLKGGLKILVEKYSASHSLIVVHALAAILGQRAKRTKLRDAYLLFEYIEKLQRKDSPALLGGIISCIKTQITRTEVWQDTKMPNSLFPFLQHCLEFTSPEAVWAHRGLSDWVELGAIDLLWAICEHKIYDLNFDENQRKWIEDKVREIATANPDNETFQRDASYFFDCIDKSEQ